MNASVPPSAHPEGDAPHAGGREPVRPGRNNIALGLAVADAQRGLFAAVLPMLYSLLCIT